MGFRLFASAAAGGLILGWAAVAAADSPGPPGATPPGGPPPPSAPIFYCPAPPPAESAGPPERHAGGAVHRHGRPGCHGRYARGGGERHEHRWASRGSDVSAGQALIYRYERAEGGFDARGADEAWGHGPPGPPPGPPPEAPPPPEAGPPGGPPPGEMGMEGHGMRHGMHPHDNGRDYGFEEHGVTAGGGHYGYLYQRSERAYDSGWRVRREGGERDGRWGMDGGGHALAWGEGDGRSWSGRDARWAGHGFHAGDRQWRDGSYGEVYEYAGRDAHGFLVWPGKTEPSPDAAPVHP